jgi:hypothetical protein
MSPYNMTRQNKPRHKRQAILVGLIGCALAVALVQCRTTADAPHAVESTRSASANTSQPAYRSLIADEPVRLRPRNHEVGWVERHGVVARASSSDCMSCHQEEDCASCHVENLAEPFSVHPPNFEVVHAVDARLDQDNCTDCHKVETFCASCHIRTRVSAIEPDDPPARVEFHPPGWIDPSSPNNHGVAARRNITECASCHQERDCVTCHQGINPHPPQFRLNCGRWLKADARACATCHTDLQGLRSRCL